MKRTIINILPDGALIGSCIAAVLMNTYFSSPRFETPFLTLFGTGLMIIGTVVGLYIITSLRINKTSTNAADTPSLLFNTGLYSVSRNPYYLSSLVVTIGFALIIGSLVAFLAPVIYFVVINFIVVPEEERKMTETFGQEYLNYKQTVRRWV